MRQFENVSVSKDTSLDRCAVQVSGRVHGEISKRVGGEVEAVERLQAPVESVVGEFKNRTSATRTARPRRTVKISRVVRQQTRAGPSTIILR